MLQVDTTFINDEEENRKETGEAGEDSDGDLD